MIYLGRKKGLGHSVTIKYSQVLDKVLNTYNRTK
ncbi:aspartyl-phosphate phosphatase Spo0E family protein [Bacillus sp. AK031]